MDKNITMDNAIKRNRVLSIIPSQPQRQDSLTDQLEDLYVVATRLGMYDAADVVRDFLDRKLNEVTRKATRRM